MGQTYRYKDGELVKAGAEKPEPATPEAGDAQGDDYEAMSRKDLYAVAKEVAPDEADWNMGRDEMLALVRGE